VADLKQQTKRLLQIVDAPDWPKFRADYEASIVGEFATCPEHELLTLHRKLHAARDLMDELERVQNVTIRRC
jgi:hypothetical protein